MKFSVIIPTCGRSAQLDRLLECLCLNEYQDAAEIIIVNNSTQDQQPQALLKKFQKKHCQLKLITESSSGASFARNAGARAAKYHHLIFLDDDVIIQPHFLTAYAKAWQKFPAAKIIGGKVVAKKEKGYLNTAEQRTLNGYDDWCFGKTAFILKPGLLELGQTVTSANMSVYYQKKEHNLFDEHLGRAFLPQIQLGSEDYELCCRTILTKQAVYYTDDSRLEVINVVSEERFSPEYLTARYWSHGVELATIQQLLNRKFPEAKLGKFNFWLLCMSVHIRLNPTALWRTVRRFLGIKRELVRLSNYIFTQPILDVRLRK